MRDHTFTDDEGRTVLVAQMNTADIHDCLRNGFVINHSDHPDDNAQSILERLQIEILIREKGLRDD